jgi:hypothetical protein
MKQTAVEWYEKEINSLFEKYEAKQISQVVFLIMKHNIFYQAKEMEKEQIMNSFADGFVEGVETQKSGEQLLFPQQYYNETYGNK